MWKTGKSNIENVKLYRDSLLLLQEDMVICKMDAARPRSIRVTRVNRETKMISISLQVTVYFGVLHGMPTARICNHVTVLT